VAMLRGRRRDWAESAVLLVVAWQSVAHVRHIPFLAIAAAVWIPDRLDEVLSRGRPAPAVERAPGSVLWPVALAAAILALVAARSLKVDRAQYPVDALQFMADRDLGGRLVVNFDWAQYALAALAPRMTVAFDGRFRTCYPQEIADMHFDFLLGDLPGKRWRSPQSGPVDPTRVLHFGDPELVLLSRRAPNAVRVMASAPDWVLLYQDALAQLWGRRDLYDSAGGASFLPASARQLEDRTPHGLVDWPAFPHYDSRREATSMSTPNPTVGTEANSSGSGPGPRRSESIQNPTTNVSRRSVIRSRRVPRSSARASTRSPGSTRIG